MDLFLDYYWFVWIARSRYADQSEGECRILFALRLEEIRRWILLAPLAINPADLDRAELNTRCACNNALAFRIHFPRLARFGVTSLSW